jgi:AraC-like DNA-binding protein
MNYTDQVAEYLRSAAPGRACQVRCADMLGISENTLLRRLTEEGASYKAMADAEKRRRAMEIVAANPKATGWDIAMHCGLTCSQSAVRAFRRWFGVTITDYKRASYVQN